MKPPHTFRKDRHSKILTAQGPRDRRVRLSIQVARRFFDLHDTLRFDKASETLGWLLTNSQPAIDDLVKNKRSSCAAVDEGCSRSDTTEAAEMRDKHYMKNTTSIDNTQDQRVSMQLEEKAKLASLLARESRAKARARARERTRQKMCVRHLLGTNKLLPHDFRIAANHLSTWNELSYLHNISCRAPYFSVGTDQVGQILPPSLLHVYFDF
ncbi:hypothetical protein DCAR_0312460 [Daucus carota subsp. sativus]|uniref:TCP domain-containing protein n=1 Tax=Daucus carota subsp. sativus TaxID=79200 RepID=A0AAF1ARX4_DAUCS|nr:hypothetical protein DCAR_0312460 [Daucus carota subsp. sativus]